MEGVLLRTVKQTQVRLAGDVSPSEHVVEHRPGDSGCAVRASAIGMHSHSLALAIEKTPYWAAALATDCVNHIVYFEWLDPADRSAIEPHRSQGFVSWVASGVDEEVGELCVGEHVESKPANLIAEGAVWQNDSAVVELRLRIRSPTAHAPKRSAYLGTVRP